MGIVKYGGILLESSRISIVTVGVLI